MIIITRPSPYGEELAALCNKANFLAKHVPLFSIEKGGDLDDLQNQLNQLSKNDIVIITSPQICHVLQSEKMQSQKLPINFPDHVHYFAIGKYTAELFEKLSKKSTAYPPETENSEGLLEYFKEIDIPINQSNVLILSGNIGRTTIKTTLESLGANVKHCHCYQRQPINYRPTFFNEIFSDTISNNEQEKIIVVTSVEHLLQLEAYCSDLLKSQCKLLVSANRIAEEAKLHKWKSIYLSDSANNQNLFKTITNICHNIGTNNNN